MSWAPSLLIDRRRDIQVDDGAKLRAARSVNQRKRIYIANDYRTDYSWSGTDEDYRTVLPGMPDYHMDQAESTAAVNPAPFLLKSAP